jgi:hypothetical protein
MAFHALLPALHKWRVFNDFQGRHGTLSAQSNAPIVSR